jgi:hypothetical protein
MITGKWLQKSIRLALEGLVPDQGRLSPEAPTGLACRVLCGGALVLPFPDWVDWTGIGLMPLLIILAALLWIWWNHGDRH